MFGDAEACPHFCRRILVTAGRPANSVTTSTKELGEPANFNKDPDILPKGLLGGAFVK
jgi:hypothetical protein